MLVASHRHEHLKGLIGLEGLQDVLALAEEPLHSSTGGDWRAELDEELGEDLLTHEGPVAQVDLRRPRQPGSHQLVNVVRAPFHRCLVPNQSSSGFMCFFFYSIKLTIKKY